MSKRGGTSEVNGFISIGGDSKNIKKKDGGVSKKENEELLRRKTDSNKAPTQSRTRISNTNSNKSLSKKSVSEQSGKNAKLGIRKSEISLAKNLEHKVSIKKEPSASSSPINKIQKTQVISDKQRIPSKDVQRSRSEVLKSKETVSNAKSPSNVSSKDKKLKASQSTSQLKKPSSFAGSSKDSPYRNSVAQKAQSRTNSQASGDRLRKTSQLKETPLKAKPSLSYSSTSKTNKQLEIGSTIRRKSSGSSSLKAKSSKKEESKERVRLVNILEDSDTDSQPQSRPFGEIPRSNTFTKEGGAPDSLTSDLSASQFQSADAPDGIRQEDLDNEYEYDDDFEASPL